MDFKTMKLSDIRIPEIFQDHPPKREKVEDRKAAAKNKPLFVPVNAHGWLTGRYASYIAALELGHADILTVPGNDTCTVVRAVFSDRGKEYTWAVPAHILAGWSERHIDCSQGLKLAVRTPRGVRRVQAVGFDTVPFPSGHSDILGLWSMAKYRPEQHAEHVRMCGAIADYCSGHGISSLVDFVREAEHDPQAAHLYQFAAGKHSVQARRDAIQRAIDAKQRGDGHA